MAKIDGLQGATIRAVERELGAIEDSYAEGQQSKKYLRKKEYLEGLLDKVSRNEECTDKVKIFREYRDGTIRRRTCAKVDLTWFLDQGYTNDGGDALEAAPVKTPKKKKATDQVEATD